MEKYKFAGQRLTVKNGAGISLMGEMLDGKEFIAEDYWMNVAGKSWKCVDGNHAVMEYIVRSLKRITPPPMDDEVVYGKIGGYGHLFHVSELLIPGQREPKLHELKIDTKYYNDVLSGKKNFEVRKNDRDYAVGDLLSLNEVVKDKFSHLPIYTERRLLVEITYILNDPTYCKDGYVIMGIKEYNKKKGCVHI